MAVKQLGFNSWQSSLTGQVYDSEPAAKHYDNLERMRSTPQSAGSKLLDSLSTGQLKSLIEEMNIQADAVQGNINWQEAQKEFVAANPDYLTTPANGNALAAVLVERGKLNPNGVFLGTMEDMQEVYQDLAEKGIVQLRKGARLPQRANPADAYAMPLEELEGRARGW